MKQRHNRRCIYCRERTAPDYKDVAKLQGLLSRFSKIEPQGRTGLCAKHQRMAARSIKQARHLALLPYSVR